MQTTCTCTARAQCTPAPFFIRRQVGLAKVHPCTEFGVASSKFTFTGGSHVKKVFLPWRVQPAPLWNGNPKSTQVGMVHVRPASLRSAVPSVWPESACDFFLQAFTRRHVPRATCRRQTRDRHHSRSGVSARPSVPPRSRSDQPFGRCARKCLDTHTDTLTNTIRPTFFRRPTGGNLRS